MAGRIKKFMTLAAILLTGTCCADASVCKGEGYDVYNYDRWGEAVPSQAGYEAVKSVSGDILGVGSFSSPSDLFRNDDGTLYIVDSGNSRIILVDENVDTVLDIFDSVMYHGSKLPLKEPKGIFVSHDDTMYIADTENSRVIRCSRDHEADMIIEKPVSGLYPSDLTFYPQKVIADKAGNVYVVVNNITGGVLMYNSDGDFTGFFGANRVEKTSKVIWNHFWRAFATDSMRKYMKNSVPSPVSNFDIDKDGFVYTCCDSSSKETDLVKKVNAAGYNLFADIKTDFGDSPTADYSNFPQNSFTDVDISDTGMINCLDYENGRIFQYDEDCNLLFIFGAKGNQLGTFGQVSSLESSDEKIYIADSQKNTVTIFEETDFGATVHKAACLYNDGYYEEALEPWREVLKMDGNYRRAFIGISGALLNKGDYKGAMKYAKLADSQERYNKAFEGYRREFVQKYFGFIMAVVIIVTAGSIYLSRKRKQKRKEAEHHDGSI